MINHSSSKLLGLLFSFFFYLLSLAGCASQSVKLVHPQSGSTVWCGATGMGFMFGGAESFMGGCLNRYERQGYVPLEKLTPEQRADLERRGLLPKAEEPPPPIGY